MGEQLQQLASLIFLFDKPKGSGAQQKQTLTLFTPSQSHSHSVQNRSLQSNDASPDQVQLRVRAHSTGAGSGSSTRSAASQACKERARLLSGQSFGLGPGASASGEPPHDDLRRQPDARRALNAGSGNRGSDEAVAGGNRAGRCTLTAIERSRSGDVAGMGEVAGNTKGKQQLEVEQEQGQEQEMRQQQQQQQQEDEHRRKKDLLNKKSFTCMLVGARQTGKRTIVKCFVKLLNEFKLAAFEYKKEKMLTKLMNCSEQLQSLMDQRQLELELQQQDTDRRVSMAPADLHRSRINSWLEGGTGGGGGGGTSNESNSNSAVNRLLNLPNAGKRRINSVVSAISGLTHAYQQDPNQQQQQRRHTAIDHGQHLQHLQDPAGARSPAARSPDDATAADAQRFLRVDTPNMLSVCHRSSDTRINYTGTDQEASGESVCSRLQVPVPGDCRPANPSPEPAHQQTVFDNSSPNSSRRPTQQLAAGSDPSGHELAAREFGRLRNMSLALRRKPMLSLKELNKRRIRVLFKTRRRLSDRLLESGQDESMQQQSQQSPSIWPDIFIVVYSISDRDSFEIAKTFIGQLRSVRQNSSLPVILVANKIDLERAKVVKSDEGWTLARKNACKFMEVSCTVGFNLDNLLVGLRTQLILKHHLTLNSIIQQGKSSRECHSKAEEKGEKTKGGDNILVRFYKRYMMDNHGSNYECDNFSKL